MPNSSTIGFGIFRHYTLGDREVGADDAIYTELPARNYGDHCDKISGQWKHNVKRSFCVLL
jgi:hypothetical protein